MTQGSIIAFFNNKGGVSKTTTCFNLGWKLSTLGHKVVIVDADPQCNLTGLAMGVDGADMSPEDYRSYSEVNLYDSLLPAMKSTGTKIAAPTLRMVAENENLLLLPGNVRLAEVETQLATALGMGSMLPAMQNVPGSFGELYTKILEKEQADFLLIDMSPSLGAINQVNLLNSDFFIVPMIPDIFSVMALDSLRTAIPGWVKWAERVRQLRMFSDNDILYSFEPKKPKFLGDVIQRYRPRNGMPTQTFSEYFKLLDAAVESDFIPTLRENGLTLSDEAYAIGAPNYRLAEIPDFNSLIAASQSKHKPVFELESSDLSTQGAAAEGQMEKVADFDNIFSEFAVLVVELVASDRAASNRSSGNAR